MDVIWRCTFIWDWIHEVTRIKSLSLYCLKYIKMGKDTSLPHSWQCRQDHNHKSLVRNSRGQMWGSGEASVRFYGATCLAFSLVFSASVCKTVSKLLSLIFFKERSAISLHMVQISWHRSELNPCPGSERNFSWEKSPGGRTAGESLLTALHNIPHWKAGTKGTLQLQIFQEQGLPPDRAVSKNLDFETLDSHIKDL